MVVAVAASSWLTFTDGAADQVYRENDAPLQASIDHCADGPSVFFVSAVLSMFFCIPFDHVQNAK